MCKSGFEASSNRKVPLPPDCLKFNYSSHSILSVAIMSLFSLCASSFVANILLDTKVLYPPFPRYTFIHPSFLIGAKHKSCGLIAFG